MAEIPANSALIMDRGIPLGNSLDVDGRRALHVKIKNTPLEPIDVNITGGGGGSGSPILAGSLTASAAALTFVTASLSSAVILASNPLRNGIILVNNSNDDCFIAFASTATTSAYTIELTPFGTYTNDALVYTGVISAIWDGAASGQINITELTPPTNPSSSTTLTSIPTSVTSVSVVVSNPNRKGLILINDSNGDCFIAFATTASTSLFTIFLSAQGTYTMELPVYTGDISAIWGPATGNLRVTEMT